jgi:glycerophosphoryl diester phosphodiesterase
VLVVCHDTTVDRTTNGQGRIAERTHVELQQLDNAFWWVPGEQVVHDAARDAYVLRGRAPDDPTLRVMTLREVLESFPDVFLNLDIKETAPTVPGYEKALADILLEFDRVDDVIVASFHDVATERFSAAAPHVHTSLGTNASVAFFQYARGLGPRPQWRSTQVALQVPARYGDVVVIDEAFVARAHTDGLAVHAWTIDDAEEMHRLIDVGIDGIMTDFPSVLEPVLRERGVTFA